eukprot:scaffold9472_cov160-Skeletonema_dohrnii-CCMP3373.AAC.1
MYIRGVGNTVAVADAISRLDYCYCPKKNPLCRQNHKWKWNNCISLLSHYQEPAADGTMEVDEVDQSTHRECWSREVWICSRRLSS